MANDQRPDLGVPPDSAARPPAGAPAGASGGPVGGSAEAKPARRQLTPWHVLTVVLAATCVVLALFPVRAGGDDLGTTASSSAAAACTLLAQVPADGFEQDETAFEMFFRLGAAESLAMLASEQDGEYAGLSEAISMIRTSMTQRFGLETPELVEALAAAREMC